MRTIASIKKVVSKVLQDRNTDWKNFADIFGEELMTLERAGAGKDGDQEASEIFEKFDAELKRQESDA